MSRKIAVVTGTRAEYGLLYWIMKRIEASSELKLQLIVTGMHLSPAYGNTYRQIEADGFVIKKKIDMLLSSDTPQAVTKSIGLAIIEFSQAFEELQPDVLVLLGDRYEILAAAVAAVPFQIPIAHLHGGESTEGAMDEQIRHAITKMSHLHFTSTLKYSDIIKKMGEEDWRIHNVGAPGLEWIRYNPIINREKLKEQLGVSLNNEFILATFHPVTTEYEKTEQYIDNILQVLKETDTQVVITGANSDPGGYIINKKIKEAQMLNQKILFFESLGQQKYLSCMKYCSFVLGNSSSAIIEAASFCVPVVNIGSRQKGRLQSGNVINTGYSVGEIRSGIQKARSSEFRSELSHITNMYGDGNVSEKVVHILENIDLNRLIPKKLSYGIEAIEEVKA